MARPPGPSNPPPPGPKEPPPRKSKGRISITFSMKAHELENVKEVASRLGISTTEFFARAIADEIYFQDKLDAGGLILIKHKDGKTSQVNLR
ncbi:hypothetical protein ACPW96_16800 [Micromonospora sp. DT81.3]|uniref:hypothetical protein n=1 Tax=Micromonospora sp. DT81.3 TaxID=3416523 RepID=UPI003CEA3E8D